MGWVGRLLIAIALPAMLAGAARAETTAMTAPPRQQGDVTAILDQQKPDPAATTKLRAEADQAPPAGADSAALARFYYKRGEAPRCSAAMAMRSQTRRPHSRPATAICRPTSSA
jgi:hypothetical protein